LGMYVVSMFHSLLTIFQRLLQAETRVSGADTSTRCGQVFTAEEMQSIWSDICELSTPSWMTSVPSNLGDAAHGKLKADQWRALGTTYLPLSIIRLWGLANNDSPRSRRCQNILNLTMSLLSAVTIASSHTMSLALANSYLQHMQAYLAGLKSSFPEYGFHPNHHLALHLHRYLILFGPVHAWWTFPFERMIGMLQRIPTSCKIGMSKFNSSRSIS
jgi:hypothetical protein